MLRINSFTEAVRRGGFDFDVARAEHPFEYPGQPASSCNMRSCRAFGVIVPYVYENTGGSSRDDVAGSCNRLMPPGSAHRLT